MFNKKMGEYGEGMENCCSCGCHHHHEGMGMMGMGMMAMHGWEGESKKEFKLAFLKKKEKMLEAKLEFIREMMEIVRKAPMKEKKED